MFSVLNITCCSEQLVAHQYLGTILILLSTLLTIVFIVIPRKPRYPVPIDDSLIYEYQESHLALYGFRTQRMQLKNHKIKYCEVAMQNYDSLQL
ncbi:Hypothetical predicted protein [Octopus vulgaris]|uniref:Uncharacterized protein n=1 Tax=Octopus vulgaris TaxID=6645 RepID=A0AA36AVJ5_OCTVU|nr:Hypothetical predicted protein [Octopus vulgaris]